MKLKNFIKNLLLYISAFVPMYFLIFIKLIVEIINQNLSFNILNTLNFVTLLTLIVLGLFGLYYNVFKSNIKTEKITIIKTENITDKHFLGYFSLFVFFALPLDLSLVSVYCVYILVLVFIGIVYISNDLFYINPLLNIFGYKFFSIEYSKENGEICKGKIFYRGKTICKNEIAYVKIKNENFSFIDTKYKIKDETS